MPDYDLYDMVVAETLKKFIPDAMKEGGLAINNYLEMEETKYFIELANMACNLVGATCYVKMKFFSFYWFKLRNRKLMKGIKRYTDKTKLMLARTSEIGNEIIEQFDLSHTIFEDIYKEYYQVD